VEEKPAAPLGLIWRTTFSRHSLSETRRKPSSDEHLRGLFFTMSKGV
jgi:hypothetical protein